MLSSSSSTRLAAQASLRELGALAGCATALAFIRDMSLGPPRAGLISCGIAAHARVLSPRPAHDLLGEHCRRGLSRSAVDQNRQFRMHQNLRGLAAEEKR